MSSSQEALARAYRYCAWINRNHYENFPVGSWLLPARVRPHIEAIYAFARTADDFADEKKYQGRSLELLGAWQKGLHAPTRPRPAFDGPSAHPIFLALADTIEKLNLPVQLFDDLLGAFRMDVTKRRYADWEELMVYCRYSANPVGRLVLLAFGVKDPQLHAFSDRICTGLQLANHWQDLGIDLARDMLYVPESLLRKHGLSVEDLKGLLRSQAGPRRDLPPGFHALMEELVGRARALFDEGEPLLMRVGSRRLRLELTLTVMGGRSILDRIKRGGFNVFRNRPVLSGRAKLGLLSRAAVRALAVGPGR